MDGQSDFPVRWNKLCSLTFTDLTFGMPILTKLYSLLFLLALAATPALAQVTTTPPPSNVTSKGQRIVQFTGLVVSGEKAYGVPGVNVLFPRTQRGTVTNNVGYFSIPVLEGDTALISAIGYRRQVYPIPVSKEASHSVIIYLQADTLQLPTVEVSPYPTEELFKRAVLSLNIDDPNLRNARENLDPYKMETMAREMGMTPTENFRFANTADITKMEQRRMAPQLQLTNPFAWARFIQSVKRGDFKRKDKQDREDE